MLVREAAWRDEKAGGEGLGGGLRRRRRPRTTNYTRSETGLKTARCQQRFFPELRSVAYWCIHRHRRKEEKKEDPKSQKEDEDEKRKEKAPGRKHGRNEDLRQCPGTLGGASVAR